MDPTSHSHLLARQRLLYAIMGALSFFFSFPWFSCGGVHLILIAVQSHVNKDTLKNLYHIIFLCSFLEF